MMIRPMGAHIGPPGNGVSGGTSYRHRAPPPRNYHTAPIGHHGPLLPGQTGVPPPPSSSNMGPQQSSVRFAQHRLLGPGSDPASGMMTLHPQEKR